MDTKKIKFIEGRLCYLRPLVKEDVNKEYLSWINKETILRYLDYGRFPTSLSELSEYVRSKVKSKESIFLAIVNKRTHRHIGNVKLEPINWVNRTTGFSIFIGEEKNRNRGIGKEVIKLMIDCAFYRLNLHRISLGVIEGNKRALKLYKKFGFKIEGIEREAIYDPIMKRYINNIKMGLLRQEYDHQNKNKKHQKR